MHAHNLFINQSYQRQVVEAVAKCLKQRNFVPSLDLIEEAVDPGNGLTLVVSPQNYYLLRESHFQSEEKADHLARLFASVHVVAHEQQS